MFKDVEFMTAQEKELTLKAWKRFIKALANDKPAIDNYFTKRIYRHLMHHCSFIAHYDRWGFFTTYFEEPEKTIKFITQFDKDHGFKSIEYGMTYWYTDEDYRDINSEMCKVVDEYKRQIYERLQKGQKDKDVERATSLLGKHGIKIATS